jgi:hypothetical protein
MVDFFLNYHFEKQIEISPPEIFIRELEQEDEFENNFKIFSLHIQNISNSHFVKDGFKIQHCQPKTLDFTINYDSKIDNDGNISKEKSVIKKFNLKRVTRKKLLTKKHYF